MKKNLCTLLLMAVCSLSFAQYVRQGNTIIADGQVNAIVDGLNNGQYATTFTVGATPNGVAPRSEFLIRSQAGDYHHFFRYCQYSAL